MRAKSQVAGAARGSILIESSTASVQWVKELSKLAKEQGCEFLDCPVTGSKVHAGASNTAADRHDKFWALYGASDVNDVLIHGALGDAAVDTLLVDGVALNDVYVTFGSNAQTLPASYSTPFDGNLDGHVDGVDLNQLYANFGTIWRI